jgi:hypothetical protein
VEDREEGAAMNEEQEQQEHLEEILFQSLSFHTKPPQFSAQVIMVAIAFSRSVTLSKQFWCPLMLGACLPVCCI